MPEEADVFNKAISIKPDYAEVYYDRSCPQDQSKLEEAIKLAKVISLNDYAEAYNNMGIVLQDQGKIDEAIDTTIKLSPSSLIMPVYQHGR